MDISLVFFDHVVVPWSKAIELAENESELQIALIDCKIRCQGVSDKYQSVLSNVHHDICQKDLILCCLSKEECLQYSEIVDREKSNCDAFKQLIQPLIDDCDKWAKQVAKKVISAQMWYLLSGALIFPAILAILLFANPAAIILPQRTDVAVFFQKIIQPPQDKGPNLMFLYFLVLTCVYLTYRNKKYYNNFQRIKKSIEAKIPHLRLMKSHIAILMDRLNEIHQILEKQLGDEESLSNEEMRSLRRKFSNLKEKVNNIRAEMIPAKIIN